MRKILENSKKLLALVLVAAIAFIAVTTTTRAVTNTINIGDARDLPAYVGGASASIKTTTDGKYLYCLEMAKKTPMNTTATLTGERDAGITYLILNGFPNKSFTGDESKDYYITQTAIWWYLDETTGTTNLGERFKVSGPDEHGLRSHIKNLVDNAVAAKNEGYTSKTNLSVDTENDKFQINGEYYTATINVATNAETYTVSLEGAPEGTKIVGAASGTEATTLNNNEGFIIKVPTAKVDKNDLSVKAVVTANGKAYKALEYTPSGDMQKVTPGDIEPTDDKVTASIDLGLTTSKVSVIKYDVTTNQPLAGAKLVLKDSNGEVITSWTSTTNAHVIRNLTDGDYTISEEEAPVGYELSDEVVKFTISKDSDVVTVKFYNAPKEDTVVNITKIDSQTGNSLAGAVMVVKDSNGNVVEEFTTTEESHVITGLAFGTYTLSEVSAPAGYKKSDEVMEFTLDKDHITYQIKYANYKEVPVPNTSTNSLIFTILGIAIIGSGLGFVYKNGKTAE